MPIATARVLLRVTRTERPQERRVALARPIKKIRDLFADRGFRLNCPDWTALQLNFKSDRINPHGLVQVTRKDNMPQRPWKRDWSSDSARAPSALPCSTMSIVDRHHVTIQLQRETNSLQTSTRALISSN
jgi:hypothetical protein